MTASAQFNLPFAPALAWTRETFVVSPANAAAVAALDRWAGQGALALVGPEGAGKSHLAQAWAEAAGAAIVLARQAIPLEGDAAILVEDVDLGVQDDALFHLLNQAAQAGRGVLLTARRRPLEWPAALPDLRSRLNALAVAELSEPDDALLHGVLKQLFKARRIRPDEDIYPYLLARMARSAAAARTLVARLDEAGAAKGRAINRALAREVLEETAGLFDEGEER